MATQREVADHLDLSVKRVSELIRDGILPSKPGRSPLNIDVCRVAYISYLRKLGGYHKRSGSGDIAEEKTKLTAAQARKAELEVEELEGNLIPSQLVEDTWIDYVANARAKLLALPSRVAHQVITIDTYSEAEELIKDQVHEALDELAQNGIPKKYRQSSEQDQSDLESSTNT